MEVINAGVPGSSLEKATKRIDELRTTDPDIVTIYLGWNGTIGRADPAKLSTLYRYSALYKVFYHLIQNRSDTGLSETINHQTYRRLAERCAPLFVLGGWLLWKSMYRRNWWLFFVSHGLVLMAWVTVIYWFVFLVHF